MEDAASAALVFELRQSQSTGEYMVRASYVAQTFDQLRNQTALTLTAPLASALCSSPACGISNATFDCPLATFVQIAKNANDSNSADTVNRELVRLAVSVPD